MIKSITSVKVASRRVIVRAGFDVPLKKNGHTEKWEVADSTRIKDALPTLKYLIEQEARIIIMAHLGRPEGSDPTKSLWTVAENLGEFLDYKVIKIKDKLPGENSQTINFLTGDITKENYSGLSKQIPPGSILFLENLRFYPGEKKNDQKFIEILGSFGDIYVDEAFSNAHREDASMFGLAKKLPGYAGISFLKEIKSLERVIKNPAKPLVVMMGGIKIEDKVQTLNNLAKHASHIILGGGLANTFLKAKGFEIGKSKASNVALAKELLRNFKDKIILPVDVVVATNLEAKPRSVMAEKVGVEDMIFDIGPKSIRKFSGIVKEAKTLIWNGPFGLLENARYAHGSKAMAQVFASRSKGKAFGVVGGGETIEAVDQAKVVQFIDHVSTGGGAMLEFLAGKKLPAIKALEGK
jgi:phosphoglycerate kinase